MNDLASRMDSMASLIKHSDTISDDQLDQMRSLFREAARHIEIMEQMLFPLSFRYRREGDIVHVELEAEIDREYLAELLGFLSENLA